MINIFSYLKNLFRRDIMPPEAINGAWYRLKPWNVIKKRLDGNRNKKEYYEVYCNLKKSLKNEWWINDAVFKYVVVLNYRHVPIEWVDKK